MRKAQAENTIDLSRFKPGRRMLSAYSTVGGRGTAESLRPKIIPFSLYQLKGVVKGSVP